VEFQNADVETNLPITIHNRPNPIIPEIIAQHENSLPINGVLANHAHLSSTNINGNDYQIIPTSNSPMDKAPPINTPGPSLIAHNNPSHRFNIANIHSSITNNQFTPLFLTQPEIDPPGTQSSTAQILSFSNQPLTRDPLPSKVSNTYTTSRASFTKSMQNRPTLNTRPNPNRNKPIKKPIKPVLHSNPTHTQPDPSTTQLLLDDMDSQTEKKRRREEVADDTKQSEENQHFLTAGPGSQACRDQ
jgi:hypothetical protein